MDVKSAYSEIVDAWKKKGPPSRPSKHEMKIYERRAAAFGRRAKVLVLGATPELRNLCAKCGFETTVVDMNEKMISAMSELMSSRPKEEIIVGDWLKVDLKNNFYDIVLGDFVMNLIRKSDMEKFLAKIKNSLKPNGIFLTRILVFLPEKERTRCSEIILSYISGKIRLEDIFYELLLYSDIAAYDSKRNVAHISNFFISLDKLHKSGMIDDEIYRHLNLHRSRLSAFILPDKELESILSLSFAIKSEKCPEFLYGNYSPIYVLRPIHRTA